MVRTILHVNRLDRRGGAALSAWNLFKTQQQLGYQVWFAVGEKFSDDPNVLRIPNPPQKNPPDRIADWLGWLEARQSRRLYHKLHYYLRVMTQGMPGMARALGFEYFGYPGTRRLLSLTPQPPDILHMHNLHIDYFDLRMLPQLSRAVPTILNLRDLWTITGHCAYPAACERWKTGCGHCPDLTLYPGMGKDQTAYNWHRKRRIYQNSKFYINVPSQYMLEKINQSILAGFPARVIPNAIDLKTFHPGAMASARARLNLPEHAKIVLLTGQTMFKDLETMQQGLERIQHIGDLLFICLGRIGESHPLGQGTMIYPGWIEDTEIMASYYQAADVFIHAAIDEAFGKTIAEAMACGRPVIASNNCAIPELIRDGETGYLFPPGDAQALAARIAAVLSDPDLAQRVGQAAARYAASNFDLVVQARRFLDWYEEIQAHFHSGQKLSASA